MDFSKIPSTNALLEMEDVLSALYEMILESGVEDAFSTCYEELDAEINRRFT